MKTKNTQKLYDHLSKNEDQIQKIVASTLYTMPETFDNIPNEEDVIREHEVFQKVEVSFGLDALTLQHLMKY